MRYLQTVLCILLLSSLLMGQDIRKRPGDKAIGDGIKFFDGNPGEKPTYSVPAEKVGRSINNFSATNPPKASNITWTLIDIGRFLSVGQSNIRPLTYDPDLGGSNGVLVHVHQGYAGPVDSGGYSPWIRAAYYSYSTDVGSTWTRMPDPVNFPDPWYTLPVTGAATCAWPSSAIWNPTGNLADAWWFGAWEGNNNPDGREPPDATAEYQDAMFDYDFPLFSNTPVNNRQLGGVYHSGKGFRDSTWFYDNGPHITFTSQTNMLDLYSAMDAPDFGNATKVKRGIARYDGTGSIDYYVPATWDTMAWGTFGEHMGGDAITAPGGVKKVVACYYGGYNEYQNWDSTLLKSRIALSYSTNDGATFGAWDTIPLSTMPGLGTKRNVWRYGSRAGNQVNGAVLLDTLGDPHVFTVMQTEPSTSSSTNPSVAELYKEAGVWKAKIIGSLNPNAKLTYGTFDQWGCCLSSARNKNGTGFFVSYTSNVTDGHSDIYVSGRDRISTNWANPVNITNTPGVEETINHIASVAHKTGPFAYDLCLTYTSVPNEANANVGNASFWFGKYNIDVTPIAYDNSAEGFPTVAGKTCTPDTSFPVLKGTVRNNGELANPGSFPVRYRILKGNTVLLAESLTTTALALQETRDITFPGSFQPPDTGVYTLELLVKGADQAASNDTARASLTVIYPSTIALTKAAKLAKTYQEISGTSLGLNNDDSSKSVALPFTFKFDGVVYDSVSASTNGWMEFGKADTTDSILVLHRRESSGSGSENNTRLATSYTTYQKHNPGDHNNKVLGAWWEDMATYGEFRGTSDSGDISYTTQGTAPNRVFVVQWKNMAARYEDLNRGTRLNWQVRLYENSNEIEFDYGPIVEGEFTNAVLTGGQFGASIGVADTTGGPFHYCDVMKYITGGYGYGDGNFLESTLNPLISWPGPDSAIRLTAGTAKLITTQLNPRWNLISNPIEGNQPVNSIFPTPNRVSGTTWEYTPGSGYSTTSTLQPGKGYWTKFVVSPTAQVITGAPVLSTNVTLANGWNLVGSVDHDVPAPPIGGIITGNTYGYVGSYQVVTTIRPGKGYWIKSSGGSLNLGPVAAPKIAPENFDAYSSVTITDKNGSKQTLFLRANSEKGLDFNRYEMPPALPAANFDVRFQHEGTIGTILEAYPVDNASVAKFPIAMQSPVYPITVSWDVKNADGKGFSLETIDMNGKVSTQQTMSGKGKVTISKGGANSLAIAVGNGPAIPKEFALGQNYPNPFNPTTQFSVEIPKTAVVDVVVYDMLGRKVATLLSGEQSAGYHTVEWNGLNTYNQAVSSGIYFIQMTSDQFNAVRKVMMMK